MSVPTRRSSPTGEPEDLLVYVERLRQQAEDFGRTIEAEIRVTLEQIGALVRQAKGGGHDR